MTFHTTAGRTYTAVVVDATDPALLRVRLSTGAELRVGRGVASVVQELSAERKAA